MKEQGQTATVVAIGLMVFCLLALISVDVGNAINVRNRLQAACDASALGGSMNMPDADTALEAAKFVAKLNGYESGVEGVVILGSPSNDHADAYQVDMTKELRTYFFRYKLEIYVTATAIMGPPPCSAHMALAPFCILNPNTNYDMQDDLNAYNYGKKYILAYGEDNICIQDWVNGDAPFWQGGYENPFLKTNSQGWRSALRLPIEDDVGGAALFKINFIYDWGGSIGVDDRVSMETGNITGAIVQGRSERLLGEEYAWFNDFDPIRDHQMRRVVWVAVVSLLDKDLSGRFTIDDYYADLPWHNKYLVIDGFAPFYLLTLDEQGDVNGDGDPKDKDWVVGYFIPGTLMRGFSPEGCDDYGGVTMARLVE